MDELWDIKRLARYLGLSERTVYEKVRSGEIPAVRVGRRWRFQPRDIEQWLESKGASVSPTRAADIPDSGTRKDTAAHDAAGAMPSREDLEALLDDVDDPIERRLAFAGLLSRACSAKGWRPPVVVGGHAVEFYTAGGYTTVDLDLVGASEPVGEVLDAWGFERDGRHWYDESLGILVEVPRARLEPEQEERTLDVEVRGEHVSVIGIEDLVIDRLNACVHWDSQESCEWAAVLVEAYADRIDWEYLWSRARSEEVGGVLQRIAGPKGAPPSPDEPDGR
ncbi:MAG: hypothetical protein Kow0056_11710 [Coriobacteriia bacterium]